MTKIINFLLTEQKEIFKAHLGFVAIIKYISISSIILYSVTCFYSTYIHKIEEANSFMLCCSRPKLKHIQDQVKGEVKHLMSGNFHTPTITKRLGSESEHGPARPALLASCSSFGPKVCVYESPRLGELQLKICASFTVFW